MSSDLPVIVTYQQYLEYVGRRLEVINEPNRYIDTEALLNLDLSPLDTLGLSIAGAAIYTASFYGDLQIVKRLAKRLAGKEVIIRCASDGSLASTVDNETTVFNFDHAHFSPLWGLLEPGFGAELFGVLRAVGADLLGNSAWRRLIPDVDLKKRYARGRAGWKLLPPLPRLTSAGVFDTHLITAIQSMVAVNGLDPAWCSDILCFVQDELVSEHQESLLPYKSTLELAWNRSEKPIPHVSYGLVPDGRDSDAMDLVLLSELVNPMLHTGFGIPEGYRLCRAPLSFVTQFEMHHRELPNGTQAPTPPRMETFLYAHKARLEGFEEIYRGEMKPIEVSAAKFVAKAFETTQEIGNALKSQQACLSFYANLRQCFSGQQVSLWEAHSLYKNMGVTTEALEIIYPNQANESDPLVTIPIAPGTRLEHEHTPLEFVARRVLVLLLSNCEGPVHFSGVSTDINDEALFAALKAYAFPGDPGLAKHIPDQPTVEAEQGARNLYQALAFVRGVDAMARYCSEARDWHVVEQVHGIGPMRPFYKQLPQSLRVKLAGSTLSL
ncbi:hypothetical protein ACYPKM_01205 [Pseudomonas aeruginosa]